MLARRLALAIAVLAGLIGSQAPEFAQQYRQRPAALWGWAATRLVAWPFSRRSRLRAARA
jgi:hypothetical protein